MNGPIRILIVEDQEEHITLIERALKTDINNFSLAKAFSLKQAHELLNNNEYDLIISDINLSDGSGIEFISENSGKKLPVILMTAFGNETQAVEAIKAGALDYLIKSQDNFAGIKRYIERALREWNNIKEKESAERAVKESEEKYAMLVENSTEGVAIIQEGLFKYINSPGAEFTGFKPDELLYKSIDEVLTFESSQKSKDIINKILCGKEADDNASLKIITRNSEIRDLEISGKLIQYMDKPAILTIFRDVTERKYIETALIESEKKYRTLQEELPIGVFRCSSNGEFQYVNPAMLKILGYNSESQLLQYNISLLSINPDEMTDVIKQIQTHGAIEAYETQVKRSDGTIIWISTSISGIFDKDNNLISTTGFLKDISGRKITEEALRKSSALYSALFQHIPIQTVVVDKEGKIIAFNNAKQISGDRIPKIGDVMYKDYAAKHIVDMYREMLECISSEKMKEFPELPYKDKVLSVKMSPFEEGVIITSNDITLQKQAEENERKSQERYRLVADNMLDMVSMVDRNGDITFLSPSHTTILGFTQQELIETKNSLNYVHPDDRYLFSHLSNNRLEKNTMFFTYRHRHKNGHYLWIEAYGHNIISQDGSYLGIVFSSRDITSRKLAEEKIEHLNELLYAIREVNQLITHEKNPERLIQKICSLLIKSRGHTNVWIALLNNSRDSITVAKQETGSKISELLEKKKDISFFPCIKKSLNNDNPVLIYGNNSFCKNCKIEEYSTASGRMIIRLEYNEKIFGIMNVGVTENFINEEDEISLLKEVAGDIAFAIYSIELEKERKELQKQLYRSARLSAVGQLAAGIAHEFNNLLSVILGHTQLSLEEDSLDEIRQSLKEIEKTTKRGSGIVIKLATFARPKEPNFTVENISSVIDDVIELQKRQLHFANIKIERKYLTNAKVSLDHGQMEQVFLNLLINSIHAVKPKGEGKIVIMTKESGNKIEVHFSDTGIGMDKDSKEKIFDPFYTTKGAWARDSHGVSGTGLGLSIVHSIIKQHNGSITAKSTKNRGTTFVIKLPLAADKKTDISIESDKSFRQKYSEIEKIREMKILLVDDEHEMTDLFHHLFVKAGFENFKVENRGEKAVSIFKKYKPDVVFLDLIMPKMSGEQVFEQIKSIDSSTPVVFMSGKLDIEKDHYLRNGVFDIIQKPFEINQIFNILNRVV
ncbi:MAG: PAS domain S-box protein [Spirochaetes bacterium]|nr:PAS domain S-box protein [Spirochaetota bacterium]